MEMKLVLAVFGNDLYRVAMGWFTISHTSSSKSSFFNFA